MAGMLTLNELRRPSVAGEIDTVVACFPDMQGRLVGKRFQAEYLPRRRLRGNPRLRLSARQRHRHGAGAGLRRRQLGKGLRRLRHEARPGDAPAHPVAAGDRAGPLRHPRPPSSRAGRAQPARHACRRRSRGSARKACRLISPPSSSSICSTRPTSRRRRRPGAASRPPAPTSRTITSSRPPRRRG